MNRQGSQYSPFLWRPSYPPPLQGPWKYWIKESNLELKPKQTRLSITSGQIWTLGPATGASWAAGRLLVHLQPAVVWWIGAHLKEPDVSRRECLKARERNSFWKAGSMPGLFTLQSPLSLSNNLPRRERERILFLAFKCSFQTQFSNIATHWNHLERFKKISDLATPQTESGSLAHKYFLKLPRQFQYAA